MRSERFALRRPALRRGLCCLLTLLLAASLGRAAAAAAEPSDDRAAVAVWLTETLDLPESVAAEITEEQIAALRAIFLEEEDALTPPAAGTALYEAAVALIGGEYGEGEECRKRLEAEGLDYWSVLHMANALRSGYAQAAQDVLDGKYGNQAARFRALARAGFDAKLVQQIVNGMLAG